MSHDHHHGHDHGHHHEQQPKSKWQPHRDWRFWTAVILMIVALGAYVLSFDEWFTPRTGGTKQQVPAAP